MRCYTPRGTEFLALYELTPLSRQNKVFLSQQCLLLDYPNILSMTVNREETNSEKKTKSLVRSTSVTYFSMVTSV